MSNAPKVGYARTPTADGGVKFTYRGLRLAPGFPAVMGILPGLAIFLVGCFVTEFGAFGPLFIFMMAYLFVFMKFVNKVERSITVYPDRIVGFKGQVIPFADITHIGWETHSQSTRWIDGSFVKAQALGVVYNVSGYTNHATATGLHNEAKQISNVAFNS